MTPLNATKVSWIVLTEISIFKKCVFPTTLEFNYVNSTKFRVPLIWLKLSGWLIYSLLIILSNSFDIELLNFERGECATRFWKIFMFGGWSFIVLIFKYIVGTIVWNISSFRKSETTTKNESALLQMFFSPDLLLKIEKNKSAILRPLKLSNQYKAHRII